MKTLINPLLGLALSLSTLAAAPQVTLLRAPNGGLQPQAVVGSDGVTHMIHYVGKPEAGDVFYVRIGRDGKQSAPIQVNQRRGVVIATGTIRGAHLAVGKNGRAHVVWNGNAKTLGVDHMNAPLFYARLNDAGTAFEPERNIITYAHGLDGGSSVAADAAGNVHVVWHGHPPDAPKGEEGRGVFVAHSKDEGKTFARERQVSSKRIGVCPCCGLRAFAAASGEVFVQYRAARGKMDRDAVLLGSRDGGASFQQLISDNWRVATCPMSSATITQAKAGVLSAWETAGQVHGALVDSATMRELKRFTPPGEGKRKHPVIVSNDRGEVLMVWAEGTGWARGGSVAWQVFGADGQPTGEQGRRNDLPVWGLATAYAKADGSFVVLY